MKTAHENRRDTMIESFIENGFDGMSREEALELLLYYAMPSVSMTSMVDKLFKDYRTFSNIISAPAEKLMRDYGLDESATTLLHALPDIIKRYKGNVGSEPIETSAAAMRFFTSVLRYETTERLMACFLNSKLGIISCETISVGDINRTAARPLALIEAANRLGCKNVIIAHNHPSQTAQPGEADIAATRLIRRALREVGIQLLDHIIVSYDGTAMSMKMAGHFPLLDK